MRTEADTNSREQSRDHKKLDPMALGAIVTAIAVSALILLWSRLAGLDLSLWHDEVATIMEFVQGGPRDILFEDYSTNNHLLFNVLTWASVELGGPTETLFRYWAVVPALAIAGSVSYWLWRTLGPATAAVFLVLLAANPLLTTLSRQARGYGLATAAVGFMVIAGWHALRPGATTRSLIPVAISATVGIFTLPTVVLPFLVLVAVLYLIHRRNAVMLILVVGVASLAWYAGALIRLVGSVDQEFGAPLAWHGPLTGPIQYLVFPIIHLFRVGYLDPFRLPPGAISLSTFPLYVIVLGLAVLGVLRLSHKGGSLQAAGFWAPIVGTFLLLTISRLWVVDRFVSFLGIPMLVLVASGVVEGFGYLRGDRRYLTIGAAAAAIFMLSLTLPTYEQLTTVPVEAFADVGEVVRQTRGLVLTNSLRPDGLDYYIDSPLVIMSAEDLETYLCATEEPRFVVIDHRVFQEEPLDTTCLRRLDGTRRTFPQLIRGNRIHVWLVGQ